MTNNTVTMFTKSTETQSTNIGASKSWGHKKRENLFVNSFVGSAARGVSYVNAKTRSSNDLSGELVTTGVNSDLAIEGSGMLVVSSSPTGAKTFTRRGDFRQDELGYWKNGADMILLAWKLDNKGELPTNSSLLSSLAPVNFSNTKGTPVATTAVSLSMNLDERKSALRGAGVLAAMQRTGLNSNTGKQNSSDIIIPEQLAASGLTLDDSFTFTSSTSGAPKTIIYGGIAIANAVNGTSPLYGATAAGGDFQFAAVPTPNRLLPGAQLKITVGTAVYNFTALQGASNAANKSFNTLAGLAAAINSVSDLKASIDREGRLYIAPTDANKQVTFENANGGDLKTKLGLIDIAAPLGGSARFNSLSTLQEAVNSDNAASLKATIEDGNIKITALLSEANFNITGTSLGKHAFTNIVRGDGTEKGRATVTINSPAHNLKTGDLVRITGLGGGGQTPDGIYAVAVDSNDNNNFKVFAMTNAPLLAFGGGGGGLAGGIAAVAPPAPSVVGGTWQKIPGQKFNSVSSSIAAVIDVPGGLFDTRLRVVQANNFAADDIIYISDFGKVNINGANISVPDGYYRVTAATGANFSFVPFYKSGLITGGVVGPFGQAPAGAEPYVPAANAGNFSYREVGYILGATPGIFGSGGLGTFNNNIMSTTGGVGSNKVKLFTTSNNYNVGDYIKFSSLAAGMVVDGITVLNGVNYKVVARDDNSVTFEVVGGIAAGGVFAGLKTYFGDAQDIQVDNISRTLNYFGIEQNKQLYEKTYDASNIDKSLSKNGAFSSSDVFSTPIKLYDSLGEEFTLMAKFAKLSSNLWAVEIAALPNADGSFDINGLRADGQITAGTISFNDNGEYQSSTIGNSLNISRKNGSAPTVFTIDWENRLNQLKSGTVTQNASDNNIELVQQNGKAAGTLQKVEVDTQGNLVGTFDSGETRKIYRAPIAMFTNVNGLEEGFGGTYNITRESGDVSLKTSGSSGAGKTIAGTLEASNTDTTDELLTVQDMSNTIRANATVAATEFSNINTILNELKQ